MIDRIDLHMHTTISDGTDSLPEILDKVRALGLDLFAVSDHDSIKGGELMPDLLVAGDPGFITGVEFSCKDELGKYHILGYGYNPAEPSIREVVRIGHKLRVQKTKARLDFLSEEYGFDFPEEEIEELLSRDNPGKPHIGLMMVKHGYAKTKEDAIKNYINKRKMGNAYVRPEEAITGILESGGIPVLAHPSYGTGDDLILGSDMEERLKHLIPMGIKGVEAYYSGFTPKIIEEMLAFAERFDLYVTAGSDYHGKNKMVKLADTNLHSVSEGPKGLHRFLSDISDRIINV